MLSAAKWNPNHGKGGLFAAGGTSGGVKDKDVKGPDHKDKLLGTKTNAVPGDYQGKTQHAVRTTAAPARANKGKGGRSRRTRKAEYSTMDNARVFARITKVDEAKRLVYTRVCDETPDNVDEQMDYGTSKPYFEAWSKNQFDASGGKSYGNVRAMHGKIAAGVVAEPLQFDDTGGAINAVLRISDDQEWAKCLDGTYTGASIGGSYVGPKTEVEVGGRTLKRYTANPIEVSLVDSPCIPTARFFDVVKLDGTTMQKEFKASEIKIEATPEEVDKFTRAMADNGVALKDVLGWIADFATAKAVDAMLETTESLALKTIESVEKREFSSAERKSAAKAGNALPDGSFPINNVSDLHNAVQAFGRAKDKAAAKAHIMKRAKALGAMDALPDSWTKEKSDKAETYGPNKLTKGMYTLSSMADCLSCLANIARDCESEDDWEEDSSAVPMKLRNLVDDAIEIFKEMTAEETEEMLAELKEHAEVGPDDESEMAMEMALAVGALKKRLNDPDLPVVELAKICDEHKEPLTPATMADMPKLIKRLLIKAGARHSKLDMQHLQAAHDHLADLGADCYGDGEKGKKAGDLTKGGNAEVTTLEQALARIKKLEDQPVPYVTLRTVSKTAASAGPDSTTQPAETKAIEKKDQVLNPDGSVNYAATAALNF